MKHQKTDQKANSKESKVGAFLVAWTISGTALSPCSAFQSSRSSQENEIGQAGLGWGQQGQRWMERESRYSKSWGRRLTKKDIEKRGRKGCKSNCWLDSFAFVVICNNLLSHLDTPRWMSHSWLTWAALNLSWWNRKNRKEYSSQGLIRRQRI